MEQANQAKLEDAGSSYYEAESTIAGLWTMHEELVDAKALDMHMAKSSRLHDLCALGVAGFVGMLLVKMLLGDRIRQTKKSKLL